MLEKNTTASYDKQIRNKLGRINKMAAVDQLETKLAELYKSTPELPKNFKDGIVQWLPWLSLLGGLLAIWSAWSIWQWAHIANNAINLLNSFSATYGNGKIVENRLSFFLWLGLAVLVIEGIIYLLAYPGLRDHKKAGWNLLFYGALLNIAYGIVVLFTTYGGVSRLVFSLIGSAIGFYFLFQIRDHYKGVKASSTASPSPSKVKKAK